MEKFGHLFEFLAALNSAYIVSNHFLENLVKNMNGYFTSVLKRLKVVKETQENNAETIGINGSKYSSHLNLDPIKALARKNETIQQQIDDIETRVETYQTKSSISTHFNYMCLFGSLYCLLILLLNGFDFDFESAYCRESFLLFNIISLATILWLLWRNHEKFPPTYNKILLIFFASTFIFPFFYFLESWFPKYTECTYNFRLLNIIIALLVPTSHFIYYSLRSMFYSRKKSKELHKEVESLKGISEGFAKEIEITFAVYETFKVDKS